MKVNRYSMTSDEDEDSTRYNFAKCPQILRGLGDTASRVFCEGRPISEHGLRQIHADLNQAWHTVISETLDGIEPEHSSNNPWDLEDHHSFYTHGSPVTTTALDYDDSMPSVPLDFRQCEITPLAGFFGENGHLDKPLSAGNVNLGLPPPDRPCGCSDGVHCEAGVSVGDGLGVSV